MAYAAYQEYSQPAAVRPPVYPVMDITVPLADAACVRRALRACDGVGILRCEPLLHAAASCASAAPRARFTVHLPAPRFAEVFGRVLACTQDGEFGALTAWSAYLKRCGLPAGG